MKILAELAERAIIEAQLRGEFDGLEGQGRPLPDQSDPFMPEALRMAYKVLKNSGYVPEAIQSQREIRALIECLENETDESRKMRQIQKVQLFLARAKIRHGGLLQEENEAYFQKVVARTTLNTTS
ncbi:DnaJ family domain-containing protein [Desulfomicrobium salsuginis]